MFLFIYEFLGHGYIACVVHIYNLVDAVGLKVETLVNERALKIAHSGNALLNALVEYRECLVGDGVDTARHIFRAIVSGIAESLDVHTRFVHFHIQREGDVMPQKFKAPVVQKFFDIGPVAGEEIIHAQNLVTHFKKAGTEVRTQKSGAAGNQDAFT